jgi:hypothetical protein
MKGIPLLNRLILPAFLVLLLVFGVLVVRKFVLSTPPEPIPVAVIEEPETSREVILYFGSADGSRLETEARDIERCPDEDTCIRGTVQALINGPVGNFVPLFPASTMVHRLVVENGTATVDFGKLLITGHPGGSLSELLTVYSLVNTLAANFPHIRQVQILIEGERVDTLKGHVGVRDPIKADFSLSRSSEEASDAAAVPGRRL